MLAFARFAPDSDLTQLALGPSGAVVVDVLTTVTALGICSIYFAFCGDNLRASYASWSSSPGDPAPSFFFCVTAFLPVFAALSLIPSVEAIAPFAGVSFEKSAVWS